MLGTVAAARSQFSGNIRIPPTGLFSGLLSPTAVMKKIVNTTIKITIPVTPPRAKNLSFSIFDTSTNGIISNETIKTMNQSWV